MGYYGDAGASKRRATHATIVRNLGMVERMAAKYGPTKLSARNPAPERTDTYARSTVWTKEQTKRRLGTAVETAGDLSSKRRRSEAAQRAAHHEHGIHWHILAQQDAPGGGKRNTLSVDNLPMAVTVTDTRALEKWRRVFVHYERYFDEVDTVSVTQCTKHGCIPTPTAILARLECSTNHWTH